MMAFLIAQTVLNILAVLASKNNLGRVICLGFGLWGAYYIAINWR